MTPPIQLQRMPKRRKPTKPTKPAKPAAVRALFWVAGVICLAIFCAGVIAKCTPNPVFPL